MRIKKRGLGTFGHLSLAKRAGILGVAAVVTAMAVFGLPLLLPRSAAPAHYRLESAKRVFAPGEKPTLKLYADQPRLGLWFMPAAYAESQPTVAVTYDGATKTDIPATITPDGNDYTITLDTKPGQQPRAGSYTVDAAVPTNDGKTVKSQTTFAWGVLGLNTDKTVYRPGETAHIQMGVVGSNGHTLCAAPLELTVTDPSGNAKVTPYQPSNGCRGDTYNSQPDYSVDIPNTVAGTYQIKLGIQGTPYSVNGSFKVEAGAAIDVARSGLTRLYPSHPYAMGISATPTQAFKGTVREVLDSEKFNITNAGGAEVAHSGGKTTLTWHINWKPGSSQRLSYEFMPPPDSPAFYQNDPMQFISDGGQTVFTEAHGWQYVGDAAITLVKSTQVAVTVAANSNTTSVTSSAGNLLVLMFEENQTSATEGLLTVSDSAGNAWNWSSSPVNQNPPAAYLTGVSSEIAIAYVPNASAISSITVTLKNSTSTGFTYELMEFSNIATSNPVIGSAAAGNAAALTQTSPSVSLTLCDQPDTSMLLRGGSYFCSPDQAVVVTNIEAGTASTSLSGGSFTATTEQTGTSSVKGHNAYLITSASGSYSVTWNLTVSKGAGVGIMAFKQQPSGSLEHSSFWAK